MIGGETEALEVREEMDIVRKTVETVVIQIQRHQIVQTTCMNENIQ